MALVTRGLSRGGGSQGLVPTVGLGRGRAGSSATRRLEKVIQAMTDIPQLYIQLDWTVPFGMRPEDLLEANKDGPGTRIKLPKKKLETSVPYRVPQDLAAELHLLHQEMLRTALMLEQAIALRDIAHEAARQRYIRKVQKEIGQLRLKTVRLRDQLESWRQRVWERVKREEESELSELLEVLSIAYGED